MDTGEKPWHLQRTKSHWLKCVLCAVLIVGFGFHARTGLKKVTKIPNFGILMVNRVVFTK